MLTFVATVAGSQIIAHVVGHGIKTFGRRPPRRFGRIVSDSSLNQSVPVSTDSSHAKGWSVPYDLHQADASRFKCLEELLLLEDHLTCDPCPDCMNKHSVKASALLKEASTLIGGTSKDIELARLIEDIRREMNKHSNDNELKTWCNGSCPSIREIRKSIQRKLGLSHDLAEENK